MKKKPGTQAQVPGVSLPKWEIKTMSLADLRENPENPRRISDTALAALEKSLERFGPVQPIVFNKRTGYVVGGHQRKRILMKKGVQETEVVVVDLDPEEEKALNIALNSQDMTGEFTEDVSAILDSLKENLPDAYDELLLYKIRPTDEDSEEVGKENKSEGQYDLSPLPYESYHYVVLIFRNDIDWVAAQDHFKLKMMKDPTPQKKGGRIGLGTVVEGKEYLKRFMEDGS